MFIQEFVLGLPEPDLRKKRAGYLTVATELSHIYEQFEQLNED